MIEHECLAKGVGNPKDDEEEKEGEEKDKTVKNREYT